MGDDMVLGEGERERDRHFEVSTLERPFDYFIAVTVRPIGPYHGVPEIKMSGNHSFQVIIS